MGRIAGGLNSPITGIAAALSATFREVAAIVEARAEQLEEAAGGGAESEESSASAEAGE